MNLDFSKFKWIKTCETEIVNNYSNPSSSVYLLDSTEKLEFCYNPAVSYFMLFFNSLIVLLGIFLVASFIFRVRIIKKR